jgi:THO complex subunit 3
VNELAYLRRAPLFLQCTGQHEVEMLRAGDMRPLGALRGHTAGVLCLAVDAEERFLASGGADAATCLWDLEDLICLKTFLGTDFPVRSLSFSHDSKYLALGSPEEPWLVVEEVAGGGGGGRLAARTGVEDACWHPRRHVLAFTQETQEGGGIEFRVKRG